MLLKYMGDESGQIGINQGTDTSGLKSPVESYLLGGRPTVFRLVFLAQEEAGHLHLRSTALGNIAVTSRFARGGLNLGTRFAWGRGREVRQPDEAPGGSMKANSRRPISLHQPATHQEFGPGSGRRCVICWQPSWARGPGLWLPSLCAASVQPGHWGWARPAEAVSASRSRTRTAPWHVNGDEKRPSSNLAGLLSSACYRSHQPGTSPYSALPNKKK